MQKLIQIVLVMIATAFAFGQSGSLIVEYKNIKKGTQTYQNFLVVDGIDVYQIYSFWDRYDDFKSLTQDEVFLAKDYRLSDYKTLDNERVLYRSTKVDSKTGVQVYRDEIPSINWRITKEKGKVLGYDCQVAYGKFRGRMYKIWFTTQIPFPVGPWKLYGLPGLILKGVSENEIFSFEAVSIQLNSSIMVPQEYVEAYRNKENKSIPYKTFVELKEKKATLMMKRGLSSLSENIVTNVTDIDLRETEPELIYEWEAKK